MIRFKCSHCHESAIMPLDITISDKTTLTCNYCKGQTLFTLGQEWVLTIPPNPWDEHPEDWCFHEHPLKPGVVMCCHLKTEPCDLALRTFLPEPVDKPEPKH